MVAIMTFDAKKFLSSVSTHPGVYQMLDAQGKVLYVGKARNLKKRLTSYFRSAVKDVKTLAMLNEVHDVAITITHSENEALLLECNLIKKIHPPYNVLLRDDKSYPYLYLSEHEDFPRMDLYRGAKSSKGMYFGPYPSAAAVRETLDVLQKIFKIRQCTDSFFRARTRPCLQYQIQRCTAPCVDYVTVEEYQENVRHAVLFLQGKSRTVIEELAKEMEHASEDLQFETAAHYRDQIVSLRRIQEKQWINVGAGEVDVIAMVHQAGVVCIHFLYIRGGRLIGSKSFFPQVRNILEDDEILSDFLPQYYLNEIRAESLPARVILDRKLPDREWIQNALQEQLNIDIQLVDQVRSKERQWLQMAVLNARQALTTHLGKEAENYHRWESLQKALNLSNLPQRIECFDVSHVMGEATVASCVVFNIHGPSKQDYRRFNIEGVQKGDDYAALSQAVARRYIRLKENAKPLPDLLIIDGGKGQLSVVQKVLEELQVTGLTLMAIAKGPTRKAGLETLWISGREKPLDLTPDSEALHLLQYIRDEAHRFAITGHRNKRGKARLQSVLESIPGVGAKRRRDLLNHFGGLQEIKGASVEEIAKVSGISHELAKRIYEALR